MLQGKQPQHHSNCIASFLLNMIGGRMPPRKSCFGAVLVFDIWDRHEEALWRCQGLQ